jgi:hypothetical protein
LPSNDAYTDYSNDELPALYPLENCVPLWRAAIGTVFMVGGILLGMIRAVRSKKFSEFFYGYAIFIVGGVIWLAGKEPCEENSHQNNEGGYGSPNFHANNVTQKLLTMLDYCNTLIPVGRIQMANILSTDKQSTIETDNPKKPKRHVTVLHSHPVTSPLLAVRAFIVREFRNRES